MGDEQIVYGMECDGRAQQPAGSGDFQPCALPCVGKPGTHDDTAQNVHGTRAETPEKDERESVGTVLDEIAHIFKGSKRERDRDGGGLDFLVLRLKHQQVECQRQQLHDFLHHRRNLRRGSKGVCLIDRRKKGVDVGGKQTHAHPGKAKHKKAKLPSAHTQGGHQQRGHHTEEDILNVGHSSTAFLTAGSSPNRARVRSRSHQKAGLAGEVADQKQPTVQSRYSEPT